jgi:hypothetical protein
MRLYAIFETGKKQDLTPNFLSDDSIRLIDFFFFYYYYMKNQIQIHG